MMINPLMIATSVVAKTSSIDSHKPDKSLHMAAKAAIRDVSPDEMEKFMAKMMMQMMIADMGQQDDDAPDASPTLQTDLF